MAAKTLEWTGSVLEEDASRSQAWRDLLDHAARAEGAKPTKAWLARAETLIQGVGGEEFAAALPAVLARATGVGEEEWAFRLEAPDPSHARWYYDGRTVAHALKGLLWAAPLAGATPELARSTAGMLEAALRRVPGKGPMDVKVANAAVYALGAMDSAAALGQLARLSAKVTFRTTVKQIDAALNRKAEAMGVSREEVEELAVPTYGMDAVGRREVALGEASATLTVQGASVTLSFRNAAGRTVKSAPAAVRAAHAEELKELKGEVKDIARMISAQAERLDRQFLARRTWEVSTWRERYLDHPLTGTLARRIIWTLDDRAVCWHSGALRTVDGAEAEIPPEATVRLWHPIGHDVAEIQAWRAFVEDRGIVQPFKQAHREVYLLTPAEEATATYSNRFAGHVLRQHQYHALAAVRGWRDTLRLMVDDTYPPTTRPLPSYGIRAEYWVEGAGTEYGTDTLDSGAYLYLTTDQVRFYPIDAEQVSAHASGGGYGPGWGSTQVAGALPLAQVDPLVFSEVMRDVDLFVGVASVGGDPTWSDGGPGGRHRDYWQSYSFGELSTTAAGRRDLLTRLVPRLAIAPRCRITDRFLVVTGSLHTYKIHLGSGNILMSPDDRYLCIVTSARSAPTDALRLPFDGDRTLSVILSKAVMLAADEKITDETIVRQIRG